MKKLNQAETPMTLDLLLSMSCSNPDNFEDWDRWNQENNKRMRDGEEYIPYRGWNRYNITLHCVDITIVARLLEDDTYEIKDYVVQDH